MAPIHPILTQHFDISEVAFAKIDKELAALRESIRALHAFRNTFTPIHRLPPEVLTRVFFFVQSAQTIVPYYGNRAAISLSWVAVTRVSRHWREVAIRSPSLWSHISSNYPKCVVQEWLQRSKAAPLSVDLRHSSPEEAQLVAASLSRIRELKLELNFSCWNRLSPNLSSPAPFLESLTIIIPDNLQPTSTISESTFAGVTPRLRNLELTGCSVDINSSLFADLTALKLRNPPQKFSATDLLTVLRKLPRLTSLVLCDVLHIGAGPVSSNVESFALSSLESVSIRGWSFLQDLDILAHLSFPAKTIVDFHSDTQLGDPASALLDFLTVHKSSRQPWTTPPDLHNVTLTCGHSQLRLYMNGEPADSSSSRMELLQFEISGPWAGTLEMSDKPETAAIFAAMPLSSLGSFTTNCNIGINTWANVFGPLPKLKRISAAGNRAVNLLTAITNDFKTRCPADYGKKVQNKTGAKGKKKKGKGGRGGGKQNVRTTAVASTSGSSNPGMVVWDPIFPNLQTLDLHEMMFPERTEDLIAALRARKMVQKGITSMVIAECRNMSEGDTLEGLREVVNRVIWDGWDGTDDEYDECEDDVYGYDVDIDMDDYLDGISLYDWGDTYMPF
ncbi:hypothetical protein BDN72DRAFT_850182 [Pluteus cervinus]|uniref:Uncharacterized protein n=1 Tax=Pluteus cervinus TaxID=181527 RepID=A0ACD3A5F0_9AGAR|nr:hypothetical protein BDN72DRAFT_850182 [Pluteus cervinus]